MSTKGLNDWVAKVKSIAEARKWHDDIRLTPDEIKVEKLINSLVAISIAANEGKLFFKDVSKSTLPFITPYLNSFHISEVTGKPTGFAIEMAEIIIRVMCICSFLNIDLESALNAQLSYIESKGRK